MNHSSVEGGAYDLVIIGSGPAGGEAAAAARLRGKSVLMVEKGALGGTCRNVGCVPSKLLLAAAASRANAATPRFAGISTSAGEADLAKLVEDKDRTIAGLGLSPEGLAEQGVDLISGIAAFESASDLPVLAITRPDGAQVRVAAEHVLIAAGARPIIPRIPGVEAVDYLTSATAMALDSVPSSMLVIGANAVGLEQAQIFARLGAEVTVVDMAPRVAPREDLDVSSGLEAALADEGLTFRTGVRPTAIGRSEAGVELTVSDGATSSSLSAERVLIATGRRPATELLNLEAAGLLAGAGGEVVVDDYQRTDHPRIWAVGDVTGRARQFEYVAAAQAQLAVANAFDENKQTLDYRFLPHVTFTSPGAAGVGMTQEQAEESGQAYEVRRLPIAHVPRAMLAREPHGMVKLLSDPHTQRLLGVHVVAPEAGEVVAAATYALEAGFTIQQLAQTWSSFLTVAEALMIAAKLPPATMG